MICFFTRGGSSNVCGASDNSSAKTDVNMGLIVQRYDSANQGARQMKAERHTERGGISQLSTNIELGISKISP